MALARDRDIEVCIHFFQIHNHILTPPVLHDVSEAASL